MNIKLVFLFLVCGLTTFAYGAKVLPDACGSDSVKFAVKTENGKSAPSPPEEGKAQIVFMADFPFGWGSLVRYGVDGSWAGATNGNSYFAISVAPGEHHFCASSLKSGGFWQSFVKTASVTAEAGKVYYFEFKVTKSGGNGYVSGGGAAGQPVHVNGPVSGDFFIMTEDDGKFRIKTTEFSTSTPKK